MEKYKAIVEQWKSKNINTIAEYEAVLSNFRIVFAYNSGAIENPEITYHNTREIFENGKVVNFSGNLRTLYEIENQKMCYQYILTALEVKESITPHFIKGIHKYLTRGTYDERRWSLGERPGQFKQHDFVIGKAGQGALPEEVPGEIEELCEELTGIQDKGDNILKAAAYLHCKFENIHAFADGNGRVGRTLMNYFLMLNHYPPLIVFDNSKQSYYEALEYYDETGDISKFVSYMKMAYEKTWEVKPMPQKTLAEIIER